jgi:hypothetical protein
LARSPRQPFNKGGASERPLTGPLAFGIYGKMGWLRVADALISPSPPTLMVLFKVVLLESLDVFVWVSLLVLCVRVSVYTVLLPNIGEAGPPLVVCV